MKFPAYLSILISLIFTVMGILILGNILFSEPYFYGHQYLRTLFGGVFILYGLFRGVTGYLKLKNKSDNF